MMPDNDERFARVQELLVKFTQMDFSGRIPVSGMNDDLDAVIIGLNTLGEELAAKSLLSRDTEERVKNLLDVALKQTMMDFTAKAPISSNGDELDAIALGLNTMSEELEHHINGMREAQVKLEAVNKELEAFSYTVSHDLRAPLRAIDGYAKMIEEDYSGMLDEEGRRMISMMQYNAKKMGVLIDDLLAFSRLGRKNIQKVNVDMTEIAEGALAEIRKSQNYPAKVVIGKLHPAEGDYGLLWQVFINLISNALKYSSKSSQPLVQVSSAEQNGELVYTVQDNGVGFDMQYANKLFGVFQRLHSMEEFEGTGVGLAIVHRIITKHDGKVWAESKKNKGATFRFSLPKQE